MSMWGYVNIAKNLEQDLVAQGLASAFDLPVTDVGVAENLGRAVIRPVNADTIRDANGVSFPFRVTLFADAYPDGDERVALLQRFIDAIATPAVYDDNELEHCYYLMPGGSPIEVELDEDLLDESIVALTPASQAEISRRISTQN